MAEKSEAKSAKRSFASEIRNSKIDAKLRFTLLASLRHLLGGLKQGTVVPFKNSLFIPERKVVTTVMIHEKNDESKIIKILVPYSFLKFMISSSYPWSATLRREVVVS